MTVLSTIESKLSADLNAVVLDVTNESHMHNVPADSETHFRVVVVSDAFESQTLLNRHKRINKLLVDELNGSVHALALHTYTPSEWQARGESAEQSPECRGGGGK